MGNNRITGVEVVNPYLLAMLIGELNGLNPPQKRDKPKPQETRVQHIGSASSTYDNQGRPPHYQERPSNYRPLNVRI